MENIKSSFRERLQKIYKDFDDFSFDEWWISGQPLLDGRSPDQACMSGDAAKVEEIVAEAERRAQHR